MESGENCGEGRLLRLGHLVDGDSTAVIDDLDPAVGEEGHRDLVAVAGHGLVDSVVDHFPDEMVETAGPGRADVHAGTAPDGFESFEDRDVFCLIAVASGRHDPPK
jgi:hypothetical protein